MITIFWSLHFDLVWLQARGKRRQKGWFPAAHVKVLGSNSGKSTPAQQPRKTVPDKSAEENE